MVACVIIFKIKHHSIPSHVFFITFDLYVFALIQILEKNTYNFSLSKWKAGGELTMTGG